MAINTETHPYTVAVYHEGAQTPVRTFPGYKTEGAAMRYAEVLREQARTNGWVFKVRVERAQ